MCGIMAHLGPSNSVGLVLEGLTRLEYRGYDSAGISYLEKNSKIITQKKEGKIENLKKLVGSFENYNAFSCIGHTRWATHGEVNDKNSHPHQGDRVSIVHNGIIENEAELKKELLSQGVEFKSQTDSEVFLVMLTLYLQKNNDIKKAIVSCFKKLKGNSAFVILDSKSGDIFAIRKGAPLVCGICDVNSEAFISSDPYVLSLKAEKMYFPEEEILCHLSLSNTNLINFYEYDGSKSKRYKSKRSHISTDSIDKGDFDHFMLKEIYEQPCLIRGLVDYYFDGNESTENLKEILKKVKPKRVLISACGTAYFAGLLIQRFIQEYNKIPAYIDFSSEFRYGVSVFQKEDLGLLISQSGETADTLAVQDLYSGNDITTLSIVNVEDSTLFRNSNFNLLIRAGIEIGVASTKAFTQQVLIGRIYSFLLENGLNNLDEK